MPDPILVAKHGDVECHLLPALANRHGLITGATGTGKTVTVTLGHADYLANNGTRLEDYSLPTVISGAVGTITKSAVLNTASSLLPVVKTSPEAGDKATVTASTQGETYPWPPGKTMDVPEKSDAGLLAITFLHAPDAAPVASAMAFEQDADTISVRRAAAPLVHHGSDKVVFSSKMTEFMVANASGRLVEFMGGMVNRRLVIVAPSAESKQLAKSDTTVVLAAAVMALGKSAPIMLAKLDSVVFDLR